MKLLPCPFCGDKNTAFYEPGFISCMTCGAAGPDFHIDQNSAEASWNNRAPDGVKSLIREGHYYPQELPFTDLSTAISSVLEEARRQDAKWGVARDHTDDVWLQILMEEVGESAQAMLETRYGGPHSGATRLELVQVAAVALQWIAKIDRFANKGAESEVEG